MASGFISYLRFMGRVALIILFFMPLLSLGQKEVKLKKKYFGTYAGQIPGYKMNTGSGVVDVSSSAIYVLLDKGVIVVTIGNNKLTGTYEVLFEAKTYYLLDAKMKGQIAAERIMVYKRGKRISRDGMFPQPVSDLKKSKK